MTIRPGLVPVVMLAALVAAASCGSSPSAGPSPTPTPTPSSFVATGRAVDALTQAGYGGLTISGDGLQTSATDVSGAFTISASAPATDPRLVVFTGPGIVERRTNVRVPGAAISVSLISSGFDLNAFNQMFRSSSSLLRWTTAPPLLIETRALQFTTVGAPDQVALSDQMTDGEVAQLADDLTWALPQMTGGTFPAFASVSRQTSAEGATVHILNAGVITVTRVVGLNATAGFWGYSRWLFQPDGTVTGGMITLDRDFERSSSPFRRSLRSHELGHALGYNHVSSRPSVMNPAATIEPNTFDLDACRIAFARAPGNRPPDADPSNASLNRVGAAIWSAPIR
ncbi:MAG TPA: hypothetical protein VJN96_16925 [Vicinamibacterales bacterium]|nr:hypothetical protein [Vicinamibacterales bacterium]